MSHLMIEFFVFCFGWMHLLIKFNVEDRETIPKEGATWQNLILFHMRFLLLYININD